MTFIQQLKTAIDPVRRDILKAGKKVLVQFRGESFSAINDLRDWLKDFEAKYQETYSSHLHSESDKNALKVQIIPPIYSDESKAINGFEILNNNFERLFEKYPNIVALVRTWGRSGM